MLKEHVSDASAAAQTQGKITEGFGRAQKQPPGTHTSLFGMLDEGQSDGSLVTGSASIEVVFPPLEQEIHASGMPTLHLTASTRTCNGGQVFATLYADDLRLGHATKIGRAHV